MTTTTQPAGRPGDQLARPRDTEAGGLGELLRRARTARGLTVAQVAQQTRIPRNHLEALERGDLAAVPSDFYRRAEIRTYARAIGLDEAVALAHLDRATQGQQPPPAGKPPDPRPVPRRRGTLLAALALVVALALLGAALWRAAGDENAPSFAALDEAAISTSEPLAAHEDEPASAATLQPTAAAVTFPAQTLSEPLLDGAAARPAVTADTVPDASGAVTADVPLRPPSATLSGLVITTQPPRARVTVNGIGYGVTPVTIPYLPPGAKRIRVTLDGHRAEERVVQVTEGRRRTVTIPLRALP